MMDQAVRMAVAVIPALVAFCPCPALTGPLLSHEHITCSTEVYVRVNLEFEECQNNAINNFTNNDSGGNPCPLIKKIVGTCADNVKVKLSESEKFNHATTSSSAAASASLFRSASTNKDGSAVRRFSSTNSHSSIRRSTSAICFMEPI